MSLAAVTAVTASMADVAADVAVASQSPQDDWPLSQTEAEHLREVGAMYKSVGLSDARFQVVQHRGVLYNSYKAATPVAHVDLRMRDDCAVGFFGNEARSLTVALRNYKLTHVVDRPAELHSAAALTVNEFHHFAHKLGMTMQPSDELGTELLQRVELVDAFVMHCKHSMRNYKTFMSTMTKVQKRLTQMLSLG